MKNKKWIAAVLCGMLAMSLCACGNQDMKKDEIKDTAAEESPDSAMPYTINIEEMKDEISSEDGSVVYLEYVLHYPRITSETNPEGAEKINAFFQQEKERRIKEGEGYLEDAMDHYGTEVSWAQEEGRELYWNAYSIYSEYSVERNDGKVVSFVENAYDYTGGAHGMGGTFGITFDARTGEQLTFEDLTEDGENARVFVEEQISLQAQKMQEDYEKGVSELALYEDYVQYIPDVLRENTWYLSKEGFVVVANEYLLAPYAAGRLHFLIPWEECDFIKEEYRK